MPAEKGLQHHGIIRGLSRHRVADGVLRFQPHAGGDISELEVEVNNYGAHRGQFGQAHGNVGRDGGFPHAALRRHHWDHPSAGAWLTSFLGSREFAGAGGKGCAF